MFFERFSTSQGTGAGLLSLGLLSLVHWLLLRLGVLAAPWLAMPMLGSGLAFALLGLALLADEADAARALRRQAAFGALVAILASLALLHSLLNLPFNLHHTLGLPAERSAALVAAGMSPNAAIGFLLASLVLLLAPQARHAAVGGAIQIALMVMVALALFDLTSQWLQLDAYFSWVEELRMPPLSALGLLATVLGLTLLNRRRPWYQRFYVGRDDIKVSLISGAIVLLIAFAAGLAGFGILAATTERVLKDTLAVSLESRLRSFQFAIEDAREHLYLIAHRPRLTALLTRRTAVAPNAADQAEIERILDNILHTTSVSAITLYDARGRLVGRRGTLAPRTAFAHPLPADPNLSIVWHRRTLLQGRLAMRDDERVVAHLVADMPLPDIDRLADDVAGLGQTGAMAVCAPHAEAMRCLPNRINQFKVITVPRVVKGQPLPMGRALAGERGLGLMLDAQQQKAVAAYAPIGALGLGMVVRARTAELYRPLRTQFQYLLLLMLALVGAGLFLLRWQITPLVRKLVHEVAERRLAEERLTHLAHHDALTGLPNRTLFSDRLAQALIDARRHGRLVAVLFLDLDRFKTINDTLGHDVGDALLKRVAERLSGCVRPGDTISRLGGDEFTLILADVAQAEDVVSMGQKLLSAFAEPFVVGERELFITPSIGITLYPLDADTLDGLLKNADVAMYRAKEIGRNNCQFFRPEMNQQAHERLALEHALRRALERAEFSLVYQPIVELASGRIVGAEALLRWRHPTLGPVPPAQFIPLAEETGLIVPIGEWVLRAACAQSRAWREAGLPSLRLTVNLSIRQVRHHQLLAEVRRTLAESDTAPALLGLELTESILMQHHDAAVDTLNQLQRDGVVFSIDDFGTGYSSLSYLKRLPIAVLKIDRSFVRDLTRDANDADIVGAIITLAHRLGISVIAEGVETAEQLAFLQAQGCDAVQGFYIAEPMAATAFAALVRRTPVLAWDNPRAWRATG
jgi:diguanylate cyclase (GGDEF)-like protein